MSPTTLLKTHFPYSFCINLEITPVVMHYHAFGFMHAVCMALSIGKNKKKKKGIFSYLSL